MQDKDNKKSTLDKLFEQLSFGYSMIMLGWTYSDKMSSISSAKDLEKSALASIMMLLARLLD